MSAPTTLGTISVVRLVLMLCAVFVHYTALWLLNVWLPRVRRFQREKLVLLAVAGAMLSHLLQMVLFAAGYVVLERALQGALVEVASGRTFLEFVHFSTETYTSLGLGDVYPTGALRLIVGIESVTGLLMIGRTTSFTYLEMRRYWEQQPATD